MDKERKTFNLEIKEIADEGTFTGHLSTFGNVDAGGDVVEPGAFKKTLREKKVFPLLWSHDGSINTAIGTFSGKEDDVGLLIKGKFLIQLEAGLKAYQTVKAMMTEGVPIGLSMGYKAIKFEYDKIKEKAQEFTVRRLKEVGLFEGSVTFFPMNERAGIEAVKEDDTVDLEQKPFPNNHSCLIDGDSKVVGSQTRTHDGKKYTVRLSEHGDHSYLYPKDTWSEESARAHCKSHKGTFEPAKKDITLVCPSCGDALTFTEPVDATQPKAEPKSPEPEPANRYSVLKDAIGKLKSIGG